MTKHVIVHTVGKVGSSTLAYNLQREGISAFQTHLLEDQNIERLQQVLSRSNAKTPPHLQRSMTVRGLIEGGEQLLFITSVRDPLARNVSAFFENLRFFETPERGGPHPANPSAQELIDRFVAHYPHDYILKWFDTELRCNLGFDVYAKSFQHGQIYESSKGPYRLLALRAEDSDDSKISSVNAFTGSALSTLTHENVASNKKYAEIYGAFAQAFTPPDTMLDTLYNSAMAKAFYSDAELVAFRTKFPRAFETAA